MAGLLDYASSVAGEAKKNVQGLLADPKQALMDILNNLTARAAASQAKTKAAWATRDPQVMAQNALDSSQTALGFAPLGITAWHGSPHTFDKFSMDKIGTGEGAQAYGHGLYFAEAPGVAQKYASDLGVIGAIDSGGRQLSKGDISMIFAERLEKSGVPSGAARSQGDLWAESFVKGQIPKHSIAQNAIKDLGLRQSIDSSLYKVDIPEEAVARFLDWDKPLSEQSRHVQDIIQRFAATAPEPKNNPARRNRAAILDGDGTVPGDVLYNNVGGWRLPSETSAGLREAGIPGIRYLDGGSRGAGGGTSNFVVFDPEMIRILERNGQATGAVPWQPGEWRGLLGK